MQRKDRNFWLGLVAGAFFLRGKKKDNLTTDNKGGCLSLIVWLGLIIICFTTGWTTLGIILLLPLLLSLSIGIIKGLLASKKDDIDDN
ncbi:hypothetical protein [Treponema pedis]|uniref:hypothetical protein n=1 Tax=Treponema pedis TaxID=409322 RepID=UPI000467D0D0|nr:hypothetical protein [Treponema pedis]